MKNKNEDKYHFIKKYWKFYVFLGLIIVSLYIINEVYIQYEYYLLLALAQMFILPFIFFFYVNKREKT